MAYVSFEKR